MLTFEEFNYGLESYRLRNAQRLGGWVKVDRSQLEPEVKERLDRIKNTKRAMEAPLWRYEYHKDRGEVRLRGYTLDSEGHHINKVMSNTSADLHPIGTFNYPMRTMRR